MMHTWQSVLALTAALIAVLYSGQGLHIVRRLQELITGRIGCNPVGSVGKVTLHYFDVRGRAEPIRLLMEYANIPYTEVNFNKDTWPAFKGNGTKIGLYTFGQVPAIETASGKGLVQTQAILHYLARSAGLDCDCEDIDRCEIIAGGVEDIRSRYGKLVYNPDHTVKDREIHLTETLPLWFGYLEKLAPPVSNSPSFWVGNRLTWVDFLVFDLLDTQVGYGVYKFQNAGLLKSVQVLKSFPKLQVFYSKFKDIAGINHYLAGKSHKRRMFVVPNMPKDIMDMKLDAY